MKKRNLVTAALASLGALTFLITAVLSPPTQETQAQNPSCANCFDSVDRVIVASLNRRLRRREAAPVRPGRSERA